MGLYVASPSKGQVVGSRSSIPASMKPGPRSSSTMPADLEIIVLRHPLAVLRRQVKRPVYRSSDRALLAAGSRLLPKEAWRSFLVRPEALLRWHRQLVRRKWTRPHPEGFKTLIRHAAIP